MLSIRPANLHDVGDLTALIHEMGEYERMPVVVTKETLARDGFGPRPEFRVLIAYCPRTRAQWFWGQNHRPEV